jgi:hypothetical protein
MAQEIARLTIEQIGYSTGDKTIVTDQGFISRHVPIRKLCADQSSGQAIPIFCPFCNQDNLVLKGCTLETEEGRRIEFHYGCLRPGCEDVMILGSANLSPS